MSVFVCLGFGAINSTSQEIQCLPYAGFLKYYMKGGSLPALDNKIVTHLWASYNFIFGHTNKSLI